MTLPASGYPRAAAISPRVQYIESVDSTNAKLLDDAAAAPDAYPHLSVLVTRDQRAGRGRLDRAWTTPPGSALAVSALLRIRAVPVGLRGWIPLVAGAAMSTAIGAQVSGTVGLKWPNDVLVDELKISGILAEVMPGDPYAVVVGVGVNTAMTADQLPVPTATSFAVRGARVDEDRLLADYLDALRDGVAALAVGDGLAASVFTAVRQQCLTIGRPVTVSLPTGETMSGEALRIDDEGRLVVATSTGDRAVSAGDVIHVR